MQVKKCPRYRYRYREADMMRYEPHWSLPWARLHAHGTRAYVCTHPWITTALLLVTHPAQRSLTHPQPIYCALKFCRQVCFTPSMKI